MKKAFVWGIILALLSMTVLAADLQDTKIDYFDYKEVASGDSGVVYKIKITNTGDASKTYEVTPDTDAVRTVGTYRIDPSTKVTIKPDESETLYFYLSFDNAVTQRISVPITITSGKESTTLELAARSVGSFESQGTGFFSQLLNIALYVLLAVIVIAFLVAIFRKKKKDNDDESPEVETYY